MRPSPRPRIPKPVTRSGTRLTAVSKPRAPTIVEFPPPPPPGSKTPPMRARLATLDLADDDIIEAGPDPLDRLREAVGELEYFATPWQAAGVCAAALSKALGARAVLVHTHDPKRRELRTVAIEIAGANDLLGDVTKVDEDLVASVVIGSGKPMTLRFDGQLPRAAAHRLRKAGAKRSVVAVPAMGPASCLAVIEVIDGDGPVAEACRYAAERLGRFLVNSQSTKRAG